MREVRRLFPNDGSRWGGYQMHTSKAGLRLAVIRSMNALRPIAHTFDAIYVTGQSGEVPGAVCAYNLRKHLIILRKTDDNGSHHSHGGLVEGQAHNHSGIRYIILDDFVSAGKTLRNLMKYAPPYGVCVGVVLYAHPRGEAEAEAGFCKEFYEYDRRGDESKRWRLTRRSETSMLFNLALAPSNEATSPQRAGYGLGELTGAVPKDADCAPFWSQQQPTPASS